MYEVIMTINGDNIYNKLSPEEKDMFDTVVITDVEKCTDNSVIIHGICVEDKHPSKDYVRSIRCE